MGAPLPSINRRPLSAIGRLATNSYTVVRSANTTTYDSNGRAVAPSTSTLTITASIQPLKGRDLLRLPEGMRTKQLIKVFTQTLLRTALAPSGQLPDIIEYTDGFNYQVETVLDWTEAANYGIYIAQKVGQ